MRVCWGLGSGEKFEGGTMSNNYGFYSLILPPGKVRLRASYVGFKAMEIEIDLQRIR